jgi:hypothetical protein
MKYLIGQNSVQNDYEIMQKAIRKYNNFFNLLLNPDFLRGIIILCVCSVNRKYLLNVINTVRHNSVVNAVLDIKRKRA